MRNTKGGAAINPQGTTDEQVLFGEVSEHTVGVLKTFINNVYKPMLDRMDPEEWKMCEVEQQKEFMATFDKFAKELMEAQEDLGNEDGFGGDREQEEEEQPRRFGRRWVTTG